METGNPDVNNKLHIVNSVDLERIINCDEIFSGIYQKYGAPPNWQRPQGFTSLSKIILEQQVSLASANAHFLKLSNYVAAFTPEEILKLSDEEMLLCQVSRQKSTYLRALATEIQSGKFNLDELPSLTDEEIRIKMTRIKGIGNWTTDIYMMFCLQSKDIFPLSDIAIVNTLKELTSARTRSEMELLSAKWSPSRSLAAYFLWHYYLEKRRRTSLF